MTTKPIEFTCNICKETIENPKVGVSIDTDDNEVPYIDKGCHASHPMHVCQGCIKESNEETLAMVLHRRIEWSRAEAKRDAVPVDEVKFPRLRVTKLFDELGLTPGNRSDYLRKYIVLHHDFLTDSNARELIEILEDRLREKQVTEESEDPRRRICKLFAELKLSGRERDDHLHARAAETVWGLTDEAARELVGVLEFRLADEGEKANA